MSDKLTNKQVLAADLPDWRLLLQALHARFVTDDFASALELVDAIGAAAEEMNHHPDLDLRYGRVDVALSSHDVGGLSERDLALATAISEIARRAGARAEPARVTMLELALDTADAALVKPFWRAVLGLEHSKDREDDIVDPDGVLPSLWFQSTEPHETPRQRFHMDVWVPLDVATDRIAAALAAGGTMVSDADAPNFTVLADPEGNRVCVCTNADREPHGGT